MPAVVASRSATTCDPGRLPRRARSVTPVAALLAGVLALAAGCSNGARSRIGTDAAVPGAPSAAEIERLTASVAAGGSSFVDAFAQAVGTDFNDIAGRELVTYAKSGSADGRRQLADGTLDVAGTDVPAGETETFPDGPVLYFPSVAAPITVSYHLDDVDHLRVGPDTLAGIFGRRITRWDDPAISADNPGVRLPGRDIVVVHRSDGSGTTGNFTRYLTKAAPTTWTLGSGDTVAWPAGTQGAEKNSGVAAVIGQTDGAIGYVDLADAIKADLAFASIRNAAGNVVGPTADGTAAAVAHATVHDDLTYDPLDAPGADTYPITAPTYFLVERNQGDAARAATVRTWLRYVLSTGQAQALRLGYVGMPDPMRRRALERVAEITG